VLHSDFAGRKVRFIGDCIHGLAVEGTAQTTDAEETISNLTLCAAGMRSGFNLALAKLKSNGTDASSLGLAIGFEYGPMTITRLGIKGDLVRCSVSRGVLTAEDEQRRCTGAETAIGEIAYDNASDAVRELFGACANALSSITKPPLTSSQTMTIRSPRLRRPWHRRGCSSRPRLLLRRHSVFRTIAQARRGPTVLRDLVYRGLPQK